jgi:thiosulfate reductase/polysulfide reductase chain A
MADYRRKQLEDLPDAMPALLKDGVYYNHSKLYGVYEGKVFKTLSKKIELYNQRYADAGIDPLPVYQPPVQIPEGRFRIVVGRNAYITQGSSTNNALLHELHPENVLWIHPKPAGRMGIKHGDPVEVASPVGRGILKAHVTQETRPDTVYMDSGFGALSRGLTHVYARGACIADILEDYSDKISGNMAMHQTLVTVRKIK